MVRELRSLKGLKIVNGIVEIGEEEHAQSTSSHHQIAEEESIEFNDDTQRKRTRGKTTMAKVWTTTERFKIEVDKYGIPCTKEAAPLSSFLGVLAKNGLFCPINIRRWNDEEFAPYKMKCLKLLEKHFDFPHTQDTIMWILKNLNKRWRDWKGDLKAEFYIPKRKQQVLAKVPSVVLEEQWFGLVRQWYNSRNEELAEINKRNAKKQNNAHTCGRKSFARIRKEMEIQNGQEPDRLTLWKATHMRKDGSYVTEEVKRKLEEADSLQLNLANSSSSSNQSDINETIFKKVYGPEHNGRVRGLGLGPIPSRVFSVTSEFASTSGVSVSGTQTTELEKVRGELVEIKGKYETLRAELFDLKETIGVLLSQRGVAQPEMSTHVDQVGDGASIGSHWQAI